MAKPRSIDPENVEIDVMIAHSNFDGAKLLEIGCGEGRLCAQLVSRTALTVGFDLDPAALIAAKQRQPAIHYVAASATQIPFRSNAFDIALFGWSL